MFNQEQLAAIAAAMSILQQSMQSNPTSNAPQTPSSPPTATTSSSPNNGYLQLAAIQQQLVEAAAAAVADSQAQSTLHQDLHPHSQQRHQHLHHLSNLQQQFEPSTTVNLQRQFEPQTTVNLQQQFEPSTTVNLQQPSNQQNSFRQNQLPTNANNHAQNTVNNNSGFGTDIIINRNPRDKGNPTYGKATNLLGFMGLYVGNLSPELSKEQLEKIFSKYGKPVKAHRLIRSPVAFIKYENTESPRAAIDDLYGILLPELTLNPDQPLKLHFDRNDAQLKSNHRPTDLPKEDNGECYGWRTTVCKRGKSCPKKHIPINRGIDFQMWMIKSNSTTSTTGTTTTLTSTLTS